MHESVIETDGAAQRRKGLHVEGGYLAPVTGAGKDDGASGAHWAPSNPHQQPMTIAWGRGVYSDDGASAGNFVGGIFMASNVAIN